MACDWLAEFSGQYYVPLADYGAHRGDWLLLSSGCGIMMAVMDADQRFRWCVDVDGLKDRSRFARWAGWSQRLVAGVAVVGWFSITDPSLLRQAVAAMDQMPLAYTPGVELGAKHCGSLEEFLQQLQDFSGRIK